MFVTVSMLSLVAASRGLPVVAVKGFSPAAKQGLWAHGLQPYYGALVITAHELSDCGAWALVAPQHVESSWTRD